MENLEGKVAVVTGGASGIGLAMARRFGAAGMKLVLGDIEAEPLEAAATELADAGHEVATTICDVSDAAQVDALRDLAVERFGTAHLVCNNAGVGGGGPLESLTDNDWSWVLGVNLWGVIHGVRSFLPLLKAQDEGHVVNTASVAGLFAAPMMGPYTVSKYGVVALSETLFHELKMFGSNVGCSVLCPAWVKTRIHESARNRPDTLIDHDVDSPLQAEGALSLLESVIESGMAPEQVADRVHDAVVDRTFYILTHSDSASAVRARMDAIVAEGDPAFFFPQ